MGIKWCETAAQLQHQFAFSSGMALMLWFVPLVALHVVACVAAVIYFLIPVDKHVATEHFATGKTKSDDDENTWSIYPTFTMLQRQQDGSCLGESTWSMYTNESRCMEYIS